MYYGRDGSKQTGQICSKNMQTGFTLIEVSIVVLIIGILTAVALPQYRKTIEKARAATIFPLLKAIGEAQENYYLANGKYANSFEDLTVDIPFTGTEKWSPFWSFTDVRSNEDWSIQLGGMAVYAGRLTGPYAGSGFAYFYADWSCPPKSNGWGVCARTLTCVVKAEVAGGVGAGTDIYKKYCRELFNATKSVQAGTIASYKGMP